MAAIPKKPTLAKGAISMKKIMDYVTGLEAYYDSLLQKKANLDAENKVEASHLRTYLLTCEGKPVEAKEVSEEDVVEEEPAAEAPVNEAPADFIPAKVGMFLPSGATGSLLVQMPFTGTVRLWDGATPWSSEFDSITDTQGRPVGLKPGTDIWRTGKTPMKDTSRLLIRITEKEIIGSDQESGEVMFALDRPNVKLVIGQNPSDKKTPTFTQKGFQS